jgi:hypothetical protein
MNRLNMVADKVINPTQTAFMRGRNILEGVVILHEVVHKMHKKDLSEIILRLISKRLMTRLNGRS